MSFEFEINQRVLVDGKPGVILEREIYDGRPDYLCRLDDTSATIIGNAPGFNIGWVRADDIKNLDQP